MSSTSRLLPGLCGRCKLGESTGPALCDHCLVFVCLCRMLREHLGEKEVQLSLMFDAVEEADLANYTCYVENHIGKRSGSAILQKKGRSLFLPFAQTE